MGRPATSKPIVTVTMAGVGAGWCDGVFAGDARIVEHAARVAAQREGVRIGGVAHIAGADRADRALAALMSYVEVRCRMQELG